MFKIYSKPYCPYCRRSKDYITAKGETYEELMIGTDIDVDEFKALFPGTKTVPQITYGSEHIGGYTDLYKWYKRKEDNNNLEGLSL